MRERRRKAYRKKREIEREKGQRDDYIRRDKDTEGQRCASYIWQSNNTPDHCVSPNADTTLSRELRV